jgi:hypothetical protein
MSPLTAWQNFYVVVGSSAGALIGLTFVVITLLAGRRVRDTGWGLRAFTTPTAVHFGTVLLLAAILSAPWSALWNAALLLGLCGFAGVAYGAIVVRRLGQRIGYNPELEDWLWFALFPIVAYVALVILAALLPVRPVPALFGIGAVMVLLLFIGIRNAWDIVTYIGVLSPSQQDEGARSDDSKK